MAASLADVTDVLRKQIEASAEQAVQLKAMARSLDTVVELLEEIRDGGGLSADDDDDEDDQEEIGDEESAGLDSVVDAVAGELRNRIRRKGLGPFRKTKTLNGSAPREAAAAKTTTE